MSSIDFENCAQIVNNAKSTISIEKDPNFDDMILVVEGVRQESYELPAGKAVYVGATYSDEGAIDYANDMGLCLGYQASQASHGSQADQRYMEIGVPNDGSGSRPEKFVVISDSEDGDSHAPLRYAVTNQSSTSITLTFSDKS